MVGIVLTVPELFAGTGTVSVVGVLLTLLQAVLFAGYLIANGKVLTRIDGLTNAAWTMLGAAITMLPFAIAGGLTTPSTTRIALETLMFALVPTVLSTLVMFQAMRDVSAAVVSMIMPLEVVLAMVWSVIFLGDHIRLIQWLGAAVVITAVLLAQWLNARSIATAATPSADMPPEAAPPA
jgi:drug/metabolite transporter (DMT)-like permease